MVADALVMHFVLNANLEFFNECLDVVLIKFGFIAIDAIGINKTTKIHP